MEILSSWSEKNSDISQKVSIESNSNSQFEVGEYTAWKDNDSYIEVTYIKRVIKNMEWWIAEDKSRWDDVDLTTLPRDKIEALLSTIWFFHWEWFNERVKKPYLISSWGSLKDTHMDGMTVWWIKELSPEDIQAVIFHEMQHRHFEFNIDVWDKWTIETIYTEWIALYPDIKSHVIHNAEHGRTYTDKWIEWEEYLDTLFAVFDEVCWSHFGHPYDNPSEFFASASTLIYRRSKELLSRLEELSSEMEQESIKLIKLVVNIGQKKGMPTPLRIQRLLMW